MHFTRVLPTVLIALGATGVTCVAQPPRANAPQPSPQVAGVVRGMIKEAFAGLNEDGAIEPAIEQVASAFDLAIAFGDPADKALYVDASFAHRLTGILAQLDEPQRRDALECLNANPEFARALTFLIKPDRDRVAEVFALVGRLQQHHGETLAAHANLAAALCVVHDRPVVQHINEQRPTAPDPILLYQYFIANERKMLFGVRDMPPELLVYVVDCCASIDEMQWALKRYAGNTNVGATFFDIRYDTAYLQTGANKKVDQAGWNLPNILKFGGICADQAYFATTVGKAIGVPAAYTVGASGEAGHAWVGFVQANGQRAWWNFTTGRYEEYQGVRGVVVDPQTGRQTPDSYVSLLADFVGAATLDRHAAAAMTDAARRIIELEKSGETFEEPPEELALLESRGISTAAALNLLEAGLRGCPGYAEGWFTLRSLAEDGRLSLDEKKKWGGVLHRLCGERYPDFYLAIVKPMIETIDDVNEQNALWNAAFKVFQSRFDLAASVRLEQADMWLAANDPEKAGQCCEDVINRYANAGPFVIDALRKAERILETSNDQRRVLALYRLAWSKINKPRDMAGVFVSQSNWFRVGKMYADRLEQAGLPGDAGEVRAALGMR